MNNQTENELKRIAAKQTLGLPLTDRESALSTLYGQPATNADAVPTPTATDDKVVKQICADIVAPIIDVLTPAVKAVADAIRAGVAK